MPLRSSLAAVLVALIALVVQGCGWLGRELDDANLRDSGPEAGSGDAAALDASREAGPSDAATEPPADAAPDSGRTDAAATDSGSDSGPACMPSCVNPNGATSCAAGSCMPVCTSSHRSCDGNAANGCEANTQDDPLRCGNCTTVCPAGSGVAICNAGSCSVGCNMSGSLAIKLSFALSWPAAVVAAGSGTGELWFRLDGTQSGRTLSGTLTPCGLRLPDFTVDIVGETSGVTAPNALFDNVPSRITPQPVMVTLGGSGAAGATWTQPTVTFQVGVNLANPAADPWPASDVITTQDIDMDGKPGATLNYKTGSGYVLPRVSLAASPRADRAYMASRVQLSLAGMLTSCTQASGSATVTRFDTRVVGCHISGGSDCDASQTSVNETSRPEWQVGSASYSAIKVANGSTCAQVRAAVP